MRPGSPANVALALAKGAAAGLGGFCLLLWLGSWVVSAPAYQVIIACAMTLAVLAAGSAVVCITNRDRDRDDGPPFGARSAEAHLRSLKQATPAETTLDTDLRQRRMLLRPHGLTEAAAARLAGAYRAAVQRKRLLRAAPRHATHADTPGWATPAPPLLAAPPPRAESGGPGHPAGGPPAAITQEEPARAFSWVTGEMPAVADGAR